MHPPQLSPSSTAQLQDELVSVAQSSSPSHSLTVMATSFLFSIATAPASVSSTPSTVFPSPSPATTKEDDENNGECKLLGSFAILVQAALGALALLSLVYKRWREKPQRPLKVWSFDVSKQVVGSVMLHLLNLLMAMFSSGQIGDNLVTAASVTLGADATATATYQPNPCSFYLLNLAIDTTIGIPILIGLLKLLTIGASYTPLARPPQSIESGNYGTPPKAGWWAKQCLLYFVGLIGMKICVFIVFQLCPWLGRVGDWALRWTEGNEAVQIAFVMFIFPLIMNALQYYIIDTFIKQRKGPQLDNEEGTEQEDNEEQGGLLAGDEAGHGRSIDEDVACKTHAKSSSPKRSSQLERIISYDPDKDADGGPETQHGEGSSLITSAEEEGVEHRPRV
ncbi:hypothetical protein H2200_002062 [Cladophialophora chaetospira]|uniref:Vacuolar membrane protein n=1 Tax=Cladophialophora chaetospira TaxID=386627 RepID=A0AA39CLT0_9EURO|nr:hypothetical protein H2200_002062 [Cladophialophora chaetospira]